MGEGVGVGVSVIAVTGGLLPEVDVEIPPGLCVPVEFGKFAKKTASAIITTVARANIVPRCR